MTINDSSTDSKIYHYDTLGKLVVNECAMHSYYENGTVAYAEIQKGHLVVENEGSINLIYKNTDTTTDVQVETIGNGKVEHAHAKSADVVDNKDGDTVLNVTFDYDGVDIVSDTTVDHTSGEYKTEEDGSGWTIESGKAAVVLQAESSEDSPVIAKISNGIVLNYSTGKYYSKDTSGSDTKVVYSGSAEQALKDAVSSAKSGEVLYLFEDVTLADNTCLNIAKNILIDGLDADGETCHTIYGNIKMDRNSSPYGLLNTNANNITITLKNLQFINKNNSGTALALNNDNIKVYVDKCTMFSTQYEIYSALGNDNQYLSLNNSKLLNTIEDVDKKAYNCIYWRSNNGTVIANECTFNSVNSSSNAGGAANGFGTIVISEPHNEITSKNAYVKNNTLTFNNCSITSKENNTASSSAVAILSPFNNQVNINNCGYTSASNPAMKCCIGFYDYMLDNLDTNDTLPCYTWIEGTTKELTYQDAGMTSDIKSDIKIDGVSISTCEFKNCVQSYNWYFNAAHTGGTDWIAVNGVFSEEPDDDWEDWDCSQTPQHCASYFGYSVYKHPTDNLWKIFKDTADTHTDASGVIWTKVQ